MHRRGRSYGRDSGLEEEETQKPQRLEAPDDEERLQSRRNMDRSYKEMMRGYAEHQKALANKPDWVKIKTKNAQEPDEMTITHINQTQDLFRAEGMGAMNAECQDSEEWLRNHSIEHMKLTLKHLVDKGKVQRPVNNKSDGTVQQHIQFESADITEFEYKLNLAIEMYTKRIKWLLQGSRKMFGLVKGSRVAVVIDSSDANFGFGRLTHFSQALIQLIDDQFVDKKSLYLAAFGSDLFPLWKNAMDINCRTLEEAKEWVSKLQPRGGCNLLKALKHIYKVNGINSVLLILGSVPDQNADILCDFIEQLGVGQEIEVNTVAYDCNNQQTNVTLRRLAEESGGRYHCYHSSCEEQIYTSTDISIVLHEIQAAQDVLNKIKDMRQGLLGTALVTVQDEIEGEVAKLPPARFLPRPPGHELPLNIQMPKFTPASSEEWLSKNGLKAKGLDLYQVLAPNAYSFREEFIPVIRKTVQSQVHERAMAQFQWHDGSMKNIHVDMTQLFEYQKQMGATVKLYEKRIDWLSTASRRIFGAVVEKSVVLLIDVSTSNSNYLVHIQHSLRLLLEQQMANKDFFNIMAFGSSVEKFRPTVVRPTPENLQLAWQWLLELQCTGSRNMMAALREATQNDDEMKHDVEVEGIYVFTSGIPDQTQEVCTSYVEESCAGRRLKLHFILFNVDDYDAQGAIPSRYANITKTAECLRSIAHCSHGRFHWFRETGIIESDDIAAISLEIEKALNFSKKSGMLVDSVKKKYGDKYAMQEAQMLEYYATKPPPLPTGTQLKSLPPPKHTALSQTRCMDLVEHTAETLNPPSFRPTSAKKDGDGKRPESAKDPMQRVKSGKGKTQQAFFYTGNKNQVGAVYSQYPNQKSVRKMVKMSGIPDKEEQLTSKEWLRMYSLAKLKLDLSKLTNGLDCKHVSKPVKSLQITAEAKHCYIFPTINVGGTLKHLQLLPHELRDYESQLEKVLRRYLKRLQWLLSGSRRVFGTVVESKVAVLVDTSGSMEPHMEELKKEMASLIWDQLHRYHVKFNVVRFSNTCEKWQDTIQDPTEDNCHAAVKWVSEFTAHNNTCTLDALEMAFADPEVEAIYLLTDGKPDSSTSLVLREVTNMNQDRGIVINTISFNCEDSAANTFLRLLATETNGRFHRCHSDNDAHLVVHQLLTQGFQDLEHPVLPDFDGDDLQRLASQISMARKYLQQARTYFDMYDNLKRPEEKAHGCFGDEVTVGPGSRQRPASAKH